MCYVVYGKSDLPTLMKRFKAQQAAEAAEEAKAAITAGRSSGFEHPARPVITNEEPEAIQFLNWGLVPHWASTEQMNVLRNQTLNARAESLFDKPSFRDSVRHRRCLVLVDGFVEWQQQADGSKQPYLLRMSGGGPFALGGVWTDPRNQQLLRTFSIVTTEANALMAEIHNTKRRMPLVLPPQTERAWIDDLPATDLKSLLVPLPDGDLVAEKVKLVGKREVEVV